MNEVDTTFAVPGGNSIIVEKENNELKTKSGIIMPDVKADVNKGVEHRFTGIVKAVGGECKRLFNVNGELRLLNIGDRVLYNSYSNMTIIDPGTGKPYLLMPDWDAFCLIPNKQTITMSQEQIKGQRPNIDRDQLFSAIENS